MGVYDALSRLGQWRSEVMYSASESGAGPKNAEIQILNINSECLKLQQDILDGLALAVPFPYFHILNLMLFANISIWGYKMALTDSIFAPFVFALAMTIFLGIKELCNQ